MKRSWLLISVILSLVISAIFTNVIIDNSNALSLIVSVFSILTGFLFLIMTISSELAMPQIGLSKEEIHYEESKHEERLSRNTRLFWGYLLTLLGIFLLYIFQDFSYIKIIKIGAVLDN